MHATSDDGDRILFQPEDRDEELVLFQLFSALEPPDCWFTFEVADYPGLDAELARTAADDGPFAPGTRALIVIAPDGPEQLDWGEPSLEVGDEYRR